MKSFFKSYWLELALGALGLLGALIAFPFLPESIPAQWTDGQVSSTMPKGGLFAIPLIQLVVTVLFHWWIQESLKKFPGVGSTLSGFERLLPLMLAVIALTLELCIVLAAWGVALRIEVILLVELLLVPFVLLAFVGRKFLGK